MSVSIMIGDAENDPEMTATVGVGAIVFAAIVAGVLSYATGTYQDQSSPKLVCKSSVEQDPELISPVRQESYTVH